MSRKKNTNSQLEEGFEFDLKVCSVTKALSAASEWISKNKNFKLTFVNKKDETTHTIDHNCYPVEYKVDDDGQKWKKVYE